MNCNPEGFKKELETEVQREGGKTAEATHHCEPSEVVKAFHVADSAAILVHVEPQSVQVREIPELDQSTRHPIPRETPASTTTVIEFLRQWRELDS